VGTWFEDAILVGRLAPERGRSAYRVPPGVRFHALPYYGNLASPHEVARTFLRSARSFWRVLDNVDVVWLMGPHPVAMLMAALAALRRRRVRLGVRQDLPAYVRNRHRHRKALQVAAVLLELGWRAMARVFPVVVVGAELAGRYRKSRRLLNITISLLEDQDIMDPQHARDRRYDDELRVLSVGRLDPEKNPLLLADVLAELRRDHRPWRLIVCGEGTLEQDLRERVEALGLDSCVDFLGYVSLDEGLLDRYRSSHMFLHCSWTEGMPQVLVEAFAARLPVVATAVGGVAEGCGDAAALIPPGDAAAAAAALRRIAADAGLRDSLIEAGVARARANSASRVTRRVAEFLAAPRGSAGGGGFATAHG
jgi:glycosyltransferase involved in cell wall biosynthesis